jgi:hypothetical protein
MSLNTYLPPPYRLADKEVSFTAHDIHEEDDVEFYDIHGNKILGIEYTAGYAGYLDSSGYLDIAKNVDNNKFNIGHNGATIGQGYFMKIGPTYFKDRRNKRYVITKIIADAKNNNGEPDPENNKIIAREIIPIKNTYTYTLPDRYKGGKHRTYKSRTKKRRTHKRRTHKRRARK